MNTPTDEVWQSDRMHDAEQHMRMNVLLLFEKKVKPRKHGNGHTTTGVKMTPKHTIMQTVLKDFFSLFNLPPVILNL